MKDEAYLKLVKLGEYRFPAYFDNDMKKYGKKLISELVQAEMLAVADLDLLYDYITNVFMLNKVNAEILKATDTADLKRLQTVRNGISNNMMKQSNMLGLNIKARSSGSSKVKERQDYDSDYDFDNLEITDDWDDNL